MKYQRFTDFYVFYLTEHRRPACRRMHFAGCVLVLLTVTGALVSGQWLLLWAAPVLGYGFAWLGHLLFEKNRPATFSHPFYSLLGD